MKKPSSPDRPDSDHGKDLPGGGEKPKRLRVHKLKEGEGKVLTEDEEAFILEMTAQRVISDWTQAELAGNAGLGRGAVQHYEHRRRGITLRAALAVCRAFKSGLDSFIEAGKKRILSLLCYTHSLGMPDLI